MIDPAHLRAMVERWRSEAAALEAAPVGMTPGAVLAGEAEGLRRAAADLEGYLNDGGAE